MAALTAVYDAKRKDGKLISYPMGAGKKIYKGAMVAVLLSTGGVQPAADTAGTVFVGIAHETVDNTSGSLGTLSIRLEKAGVYTLSRLAAGATDLTKVVYCYDDNLVVTSESSTNTIVCGTVVGVPDSSHVQVLINGKVS
jgi:hypothetical protein